MTNQNMSVIVAVMLSILALTQAESSFVIDSETDFAGYQEERRNQLYDKNLASIRAGNGHVNFINTQMNSADHQKSFLNAYNQNQESVQDASRRSRNAVDSDATILDEEKGKDATKYDQGKQFSQDIIKKMENDEPMMFNYLLKITVQVEQQVIQNHMSQVLTIQKLWEANQYYYKQLKSNMEQDLYLKDGEYKKNFKKAFKAKAHADQQALICINIMERVLNQVVKKEITQDELKFKQMWVNQLRDAFSMEISDAYIQIHSLDQPEEEQQLKQFNEKMGVIHDYQEKYTDLAKKDSKIAQKSYEDWQTADGMPGWVKSLIWTIVISICCILYTLKKRQMYCWKKKEEDDDSVDDNYHQL